MVTGKLVRIKKRQFLTIIYYRPTSTKKKPNLAVRSFSLCSLLPGIKRRGKWKAKAPEDRKEINADIEIEKIEKGFVLSMWKQDTSVSKVCNGSLRSSNKKRFHSSSDTMLTDTDSGAFSVSEYSDFSDSLISIENPLIQVFSDNIEKSHITEPKTPGTSGHNTADCEGMVTVNGLCYQCI
jgi:hypothetical protein